MKRSRYVVLGLAAIFFAVALAGHIVSVFNPTGYSLPKRIANIAMVDITIISSALILTGSIVIFLAGYIIASAVLDTGTARITGIRELDGVILIIKQMIRSPFWMNLVFICFIGYLILAQILIPTGSGDTITRLRMFGAVCSALSLLTMVILGSTFGIEKADLPKGS